MYDGVSVLEEETIRNKNPASCPVASTVKEKRK